jgi:hypothetical protein
MGKNIIITEKQLIEIAKTQINDGRLLDSIKSELKAFKDDLKELYDIENYSKEIFTFLDNLRLSGITNMFGASPFLYSGKQWIENYARLNSPHLFDDDESFGEMQESYQEVIDEADNMKNIMINICIDRGDVDYDNISREVTKVSSSMVKLWMKHFSSELGKKVRNESESMEEGENVVCNNCGHSWEIVLPDEDPLLCHMCGFDEKDQSFKVEKVTDFWTNKKGDN